LEWTGIDHWKPLGSKTVEKQKRYYKKTKVMLKKYFRNGQAKLIKKVSMDALGDFEDNSLDFVYIDANHNFDFVMEDIIEWTRKVRIGGIVSGHDYYRSPIFGVVVAVNAYMKAHKIRPWFILDDEGKTKGRRNRGKNTWFFVKGWED